MYLFCDHGYGWPFSTRAMWLLKGGADLIVVYSGNNGMAGRGGYRQGVNKLWFLTRKVLTGTLAALCGAKIHTVTDVNAPEFWGGRSCRQSRCCDRVQSDFPPAID